MPRAACLGIPPELRTGAPDYKVMVKTDTQAVARLLREYAQRTSLRGGNPYRAKAYATAADNLAALSQPLEHIITAGTLTEIPGIGGAIADIITKIHQTGLRPDKILKLHQELGISSLAGLEKAASEDRIRKILRFRQRSCKIFLSRAAEGRSFIFTSRRRSLRTPLRP
jgi:DNA polymerase/3'-5' exonuclease PolX